MRIFSRENIHADVLKKKLEEVMLQDGYELRPGGNGFVGYELCSGRKSSINVNADGTLYFRFSEGRGGSVIQWLMYYRGMSFSDAVNFLNPDSMTDEEAKEQERLAKEFSRVQKVWADFVEICVEARDSEIDSLLKKNWGVTKETADLHKIGYVPVKFQFTYNKLKRRGHSDEIILLSGLLNNDKYYSCYFPGRIIIPHFESGKISYFAARETKHTPKTSSEGVPKYLKLSLHSDKNPHVGKSINNDVVFGQDCINKAEEQLIVVEGYMCALRLIQAGYRAIALGSLSVSKKLIEKLKYLLIGSKVYLAFDSERSRRGSQGALKLAKTLAEAGIDAKILTLPLDANVDKVDVAEYFKTHSDDDFDTLIANSVELFDVLTNNLKHEPTNKDFFDAVISTIGEKSPLERESLIDRAVTVLKSTSISKKILSDAVKAQIISKEKLNKESLKRRAEEILYDLKYVSDWAGEPHAVIKFDDIEKVVRVRSLDFRNWLINGFIERDERVPNKGEIDRLISIAEARACKASKINFNLRVAEKDGAFFYDICDGSNKILKITQDDWRIVDSSNDEVYFARFINMLPQVVPERGGDIKKIFNYVNIKDEGEKLVFLCALCSYLIPNFTHPIIVINGGKGSCKTTLSKIIKHLIDPAHATFYKLSSATNENVQYFYHNYLTVLDNLSFMNRNHADFLCSSVTGDGHSRRTLYANEDDTIYKYQRCIVLNSITDVVGYDDLLRRCLIFKLKNLHEGELKEERLLWQEFETDRASIFGGIIDIISQAMTIYTDVKLNNIGTLPDFARWGCAFAIALGYKQDDFIQAYSEFLVEQRSEVFENNDFAGLFLEFIRARDNWTGSATNLFSEFSAYANSHGIWINNLKGWPKAGNSLSKKIFEMKETLEKEGVEIARGMNGKDRYITINIEQEPIQDLRFEVLD